MNQWNRRQIQNLEYIYSKYSFRQLQKQKYEKRKKLHWQWQR